MAALRSDPDAASRAFVLARAAAALRLQRPRGHTAALADEIEHDVAMHREPMFDRRTSDEVRALTIEAMAESLAELDLDRAAIWMRGPRADIDVAYRALGRTATYFEVKDEPGEPPIAYIDRAIDDAPEIRPPRYKRPVTFAVGLGYTYVTIYGHDGGGPAFAGDVGYNIGRHFMAGVHLGLAQYDGTRLMVPFNVSSVDLQVVAGVELERLWGRALIGLRSDDLEEHGLNTRHTGVGLGLALGFDVFDIGPFRFGPSLGVAGLTMADVGAASLNLGVVFRN